MKILRQIPFYSFLLALFFCLHGAAENFGFITFKETMQAGFPVLLELIFLFALIYVFSRNKLYAGIITFFIGSWYVFFGAVKDGLKHVPFIERYVVLVPVLLLATIFVIFFFRKRKDLLPKITLFLNVLLIAYCLYDAAGIVFKSFIKNDAGPGNGIVFNAAALKEKPNVYFLLFDEYAGYKSLQDSFGFKNDALYSKLAADSFVVMPVFANYHYTAFSMSSILNMDYIPVLKEPGVVTWKDVQQRCSEIKDAAVFRDFEKAGYQTAGYSIFDVKDHKSLGGNTFLKGHSYILTEKIFHNRIIKDFGWGLPKAMQELSFMHEFEAGDLTAYNGKVTDSLMLQVHEHAAQPKFVYAHFLLPHYPFLYDSTGKAVPPNASLKREDAYLSYLKYCNTKMIAMTDEIIRTDAKAVIILMSDHGYRDVSFTHGAKPAYYDNICAVRNVSKTPVLYAASFSNVNFFRYFFNEQFGQQIPYLKDSTVALREKE